MLYQVHHTWVEFELTTLVVIGTDCTGSYKSNYHTITTTTAHVQVWSGKLKFTDYLTYLNEHLQYGIVNYLAF
jgi:hypothetical protein